MDVLRILRRRSDNWLAPGGVAVLSVLLGLGGEPFAELARYDRAGLAAGELWRLVTGHLVHLGWEHVAMNVAALLVLALLLRGAFTTLEWLSLMIVAGLSIDLGLYWLDTETQWYVGLSGILHGILGAGGLELIRRRIAIGPLVLAALLAKLAWEHWQGPVPLSEATAGGAVITTAHLFGAAGGLVWFGFRLAIHAGRRRPV